MKSQLTPLRRLSAFATLVAATLMGAFFVLAPLSACNSCNTKSSAEDCRAAIENIRKIRGTTQVSVGADPKKAVRACQGNSSKKTVKCFIAAKTVEDLVACEGEVGNKYLEQEQKAREDRERKLKEQDDKDAEKKKKKEEGQGD